MKKKIGRIRITLLYNTIRHLKPIQLRYRVYYFIRRQLNGNAKNFDHQKIFNGTCRSLHLLPSINNSTSYFPERSFEFLNLKHSFQDNIDWEFSKYGKLWTYNLNYFEFLLQKNISREDGVKLIGRFINSIENIHTGFDPYPLSLRILNWIKFFIFHEIYPEKYQNNLWAQIQHLTKQKEYHLLGNHLLENGFALLFGAYFFNDVCIYKQAKNILIKELNEQVLDDGAHFELSPMYHSLMTYRVLDCYNLIRSNSLFHKELELFFRDKAESMLSYLQKISYRNGKIPLVNDAAFGVAPLKSDLLSYAASLELTLCDKKLSKSGYRKLTNDNFELCVDVGEIGPSYQPGHAHADTLSFELYIHDRPVIIDAGTSTYEINETRFFERSTSAHNTVTINDENSSQVWAGHRVGKRAKTKIIEDNDYCIVASHDGYHKRFGVEHKRCIRLNDNEITIVDDIMKCEGVAHFHFHPDEDIRISGNKIYGKDFIIIFDAFLSLDIKSTHYSPLFNRNIENLSLEVTFHGDLSTKIQLI